MDRSDQSRMPRRGRTKRYSSTREPKQKRAEERERAPRSHEMTGPRPESDGVQEIRILLIGKTGNGKSATGNRILGAKSFKESVGIISATEHAQLAEDRNRKIKVVDTPDVFSEMEEADAKAEVREWRWLTSPFPTVILLVIRADVRFTHEEYTIYQETKKLLGRQLRDNLIVVFTMADKLDTNKRSFKEELGHANHELKQVLRDAQNRYVLLDNSLPLSSEQPQTEELLDHISRLSNNEYRRSTLRLLLLGVARSGKSATGNSILSRVAFPSQIAMGTVTRECRKETDLLAGHPLQIVDTPGIVNAQTFSTDFPRWCSSVDIRHGFDVIVFVMKGDDCFKDDTECQVYEAAKEVLGEAVKNQTVVVFTNGDRLSKCESDIRALLRNAPQSLRRMIQEIDNRYVIFDNVTDDVKMKALQRLDLLDLICDIVERDGHRQLSISNGAQAHQSPEQQHKKVRPADTVRDKNRSQKCILL